VTGGWTANTAAFVVPAPSFDQEPAGIAGARCPLKDLASSVQHVEGTGTVEIAADRLCVEGTLIMAVQSFRIPFMPPGKGEGT